MLIFLGIVFIILVSVFSFLLGWGLAIQFKSFYNFINYLRGREGWSARVQNGKADVRIYSGSLTQAKAIARLHESIIENA